jgi:hypothetical protein
MGERDARGSCEKEGQDFRLFGEMEEAPEMQKVRYRQQCSKELYFYF